MGIIWGLGLDLFLELLSGLIILIWVNSTVGHQVVLLINKNARNSSDYKNLQAHTA